MHVKKTRGTFKKGSSIKTVERVFQAVRFQHMVHLDLMQAIQVINVYDVYFE